MDKDIFAVMDYLARIEAAIAELESAKKEARAIIEAHVTQHGPIVYAGLKAQMVHKAESTSWPVATIRATIERWMRSNVAGLIEAAVELSNAAKVEPAKDTLVVKKEVEK